MARPFEWMNNPQPAVRPVRRSLIGSGSYTERLTSVGHKGAIGLIRQ